MSDQLWAWIFVVTGCVMAIACKHIGIGTDIGAGIIGAGINALTKAEARKNTDVTAENSPVTINQTTGE